MSDQSNLEKDLKDIVAEICEVEPEEVTPEADFEKDLGMDSMQALEILAATEKKFSIQIPEDNLGVIKDLKTMIDLTKKIIDEG